LGILFASSFFAEAQELREVQKTAIRLTVAEAVLATTAQLADRAGSPIKEVAWFSDLGERNWSFDVKASSDRGPIQVHANGFLWGSEAKIGS
jgi:hypothetical protein